MAKPLRQVMLAGIVATVALWLPPPSAAAEEVAAFDRWFSLLLSGEPIGWMHATVTRNGDRVHTREELNVSLRRGTEVVTIKATEQFVETADGTPIESKSVMKMAGQAITQTMRFEGDSIVLSTGIGEMVQEKVVPKIEGAWLTPASAAGYLEQQIARGARKISYRTVTVSTGASAIDVTHSLGGEVNVEVMGKVVPAIESSTVMSILPNLTTKEFIDTRGRLIKGKFRLGGFFDFEMVLADREVARARVNPPELMARLLVASNRTITSPRNLSSGVYELRIANEGRAGEKGAALDLPSIGYQRVLRSDGWSARVRIDLDRPVPAGRDLPDDRHLEASTMINSRDTEILRLVREAFEGQEGLSPRDKAQVLCRYVNRFITDRSLSVGFASASEVARTAQGDCTEFAVLLAAMLRAEGIPGRTVSGLVYVDRFVDRNHVFGYHMWTQAWIGPKRGGRWVDLDAALNPDRFDATHIAISTSALSDGIFVNDAMKLAPLLGRLSIRVVETGAERRGARDEG